MTAARHSRKRSVGLAKSPNRQEPHSPATDEAMPFGMPFATPDWERMVFMTKLTDPYRVILTDVHD